LPDLTDLVLVVSHQPKEVGSTEAHARIKTSQEWVGREGHPPRPERARIRYQQMTQALAQGQLPMVSTLAHDDFMDMHELFHTAHPPWTYLTSESKEVLSGMEALAFDEPAMIVTMDAGPNVHVLVPSAQAERVRKKIQTRFPEIKILKDVASYGPEIL
jgi:diphosphomevalonate decarboxylase